MKDFKSLADVFAQKQDSEELYTTDQKRRYYRSQKGLYSRTKGVFDFIHLIKSWELVVGKMMSENTIPLKIKNQTLFISAKHPIFAQELGFLTPVIIEKIQKEFPELEGKINKIKFSHSKYSSQDFRKPVQTAGPSQEVPKKKPGLHPFSPEFQKLKTKADKMFEDIDDPEIKEALTKFLLS